jgi:rhamnose transport system ATP-binding protein
LSSPILELRNISKSFAMTAALADVSFSVMPGEIHAIVGENGAGKSTLIKIMTGVYQPDQGAILADGEPVTVRSTQEAQSIGIAAIFQEPMVFPDLDVAENIFISHQRLGAVMNWRHLYKASDELISRLGVILDVRRAASGLTLAEQQTVEIARALSLNVKVLIMDEPTASLSAHEVERLLTIARALKASGVAVLYISHRLEEIFRIADRVTVLRDGKRISTRPIAEVTEDGMVREMVGRAIDSFALKVKPNPHGEKLLEVENLNREGVFSTRAKSCVLPVSLALAALMSALRCSAWNRQHPAASRWAASRFPSPRRSRPWPRASRMFRKTGESSGLPCLCRSTPTPRCPASRHS